MSTQAFFDIVHEESTDACLVIRDIGHMVTTSVTNDAEGVVKRLVRDGHLPPGRRLEYYDSDGQRDQILVHGGTFAGFAGPLVDA